LYPKPGGKIIAFLKKSKWGGESKILKLEHAYFRVLLGGQILAVELMVLRRQRYKANKSVFVLCGRRGTKHRSRRQEVALARGAPIAATNCPKARKNSEVYAEKKRERKVV